MNKQIVVVAPHPDDETLGCGGTILRHTAEGDVVHWVNITGMQSGSVFSDEQAKKRNLQIETVAEQYKFCSVHNLMFPTTKLDTIPFGDIVSRVGKIFNEVRPEVIYLPFRGDIHSDHKIVFDAVSSCTKWFRYKFVKRILAYEVMSETDFCVDPNLNGFQPNVFVDISDFLERKITILNIYDNEIGLFPFPRSEQAVRALAAVRGAASGFQAAEAFVLIKEIL